MEIHAIYENGVFRPVGPVELPDNCEVELLVHQSNTGDAKPASALPLSSIAALARQHTDNADVPADLASQHDHYLYGSPKR